MWYWCDCITLWKHSKKKKSQSFIIVLDWDHIISFWVRAQRIRAAIAAVCIFKSWIPWIEMMWGGRCKAAEICQYKEVVWLHLSESWELLVSLKSASVCVTTTLKRWTTLPFPVLCCCHSDWAGVLSFYKALLRLQTAGQCMSSPLVCTWVCMLICGRPCLCLSGCLRSYATDTVVETLRWKCLLSLAYRSLICSKWENVHCILELPIHIQILSFICWKPRLCLRGLPCWKEAFLFHMHNTVWIWITILTCFLFCWWLRQRLCVCADSLGNRYELFKFFTMSFSTSVSVDPSLLPPFSYSNLTYTLAYMSHAYSYSHPHTQSM